MEKEETTMQDTLRKVIDGLIIGIMHKNNDNLTKEDLRALFHTFKFNKARLISYLKDKFDIMPIFSRPLVDNYINTIFNSKTESKCMLLTKSGNLNVTYVYDISASLKKDEIIICLKYVASIVYEDIQYYKNGEITIDDQLYFMSFGDIKRETLNKLYIINLEKGNKWKMMNLNNMNLSNM